MYAIKLARWVGFILTASVAPVPLGNAINYQGQLKRDGIPLNDSVDLRFTLWDAASGGTADPDVLLRLNVPVVNGLFSTTLDFGAGTFVGSSHWLAIEVRHPVGSGAFTPMGARQPINAVPYALYSLNSAGGGEGGTLDEAYNHGGPGAGGTITADSGPVRIVGTGGLTVAGRVGLGTTAPLFELDIFDADSIVGIPSGPLDTELGIRHDLTTLSGETSHRWLTLRAGSDAALSRNEGADLLFERVDPRAPAPQVQMALTDDGRLGIGTASPKQRLHVDGDYYGRGHLYLYSHSGDGASGIAYIQARDDSGTSSLSLRLRTQEAGVVREAMTLLYSGEVGIGTIFPQTKFQVANGTDASPSSGGYIMAGGTASPNIVIDDNEIMARNNGSVSPLYLNNDGGDIVCGGSLDIGWELNTGPQGAQSDAACSKGKRLLGGGCFSNSVDPVLNSTPISGGTAWRCYTGPGTLVTAYAICANVK